MSAAAEWLASRAASYYRDAGQLARLRETTDELTDVQWSAVYRAIASELYKCAEIVGGDWPEGQHRYTGLGGCTCGWLADFEYEGRAAYIEAHSLHVAAVLGAFFCGECGLTDDYCGCGLIIDAPPTPSRPKALCCCGTPLVSTFEVRGKEWYCVTCETFHDWLHAQKGSEPNPSSELDARYEAARAQYASSRRGGAK